MILFVIISLVFQFFWSAVLIAAIIFCTVKGFKTKRRIFFIPVLAYFVLWAICRISAEVELLDLRSEISASIDPTAFAPLPTALPDTVQVVGDDSGPRRGRLHEMGFRYAITNRAKAYAPRPALPVYTRYNTADKNDKGEIIDSLPVPRLVFTSRGGLGYLRPESLIVNGRKIPHKAGGGPWEIIYIDKQGQPKLILYHWEPFVAVPQFFPLPILAIPFIPFRVMWLSGGNSINSNVEREMTAEFLEAALNGKTGAWP